MRDYDYTQNRYYFVTICTHQQKPNIAMQKDIVEQILFSLPERFNGLNIDWYVLMPTHIHVIFAFEGMKRSLSEVVRVFKALVTYKVKQKFWQRNYYEHVIRNEKALHNIRKYIEDNPLVERIRFEEFYRNGSDTRLPCLPAGRRRAGIRPLQELEENRQKIFDNTDILGRVYIWIRRIKNWRGSFSIGFLRIYKRLNYLKLQILIPNPHIEYLVTCMVKGFLIWDVEMVKIHILWQQRQVLSLE
ncbi:transposase [candidate division WOR-3 bacterium]|nr:transposase [candidate division WOR-3 bacterium]